MEKNKSMSKREKILEIAQILFLKKGFNNTSVELIAKEAKIAKGTLYYYYKNKNSLLREIVQKNINDNIRGFEEILNQNESPLIQMSEIILKIITKNKNKNIIQNINNEKNAALYNEVIKSVIKTYVPYISRIIRNGNKKDVFHVEYPDETSEMIMLLIGYLQNLTSVQMQRKDMEKGMNAAIKNIEKILSIESGSLKI